MAGVGLADPTEDNPEARYQALVADAKAHAPNVDWQALRIAEAQRPGFRVISRSAARREMLKAANSRDCATALPEAKATIAENYVDIDAHMVAAFCEDAAGQAAAAQLDRDIGAGLVASIQTGDGLSPAAAFTPIDVDEEYSLMRALGLHVIDQALVHQDGHAYDALTAIDDKGRKATYYFLIDRMLAVQAAENAQSGTAATPGATPPDKDAPIQLP